MALPFVSVDTIMWFLSTPNFSEYKKPVIPMNIIQKDSKSAQIFLLHM